MSDTRFMTGRDEDAVRHEARTPSVQWALVGLSLSMLLSSLGTSIANVAHFMCRLAAERRVWADWRSKLPVIVNARPVQQFA